MNLKKIFYCITTFFILIVLSGCNNESQVNDEVKNSKNNLVQNNETENLNENNSLNNANQNHLVENNNDLSKDDIIKNFFNDSVNEINEFLNSENVDNAKEKCKEYFVTFVDFIFYEGTIKDITFKEITDETKIQIINIVKSIDNTIMKKFPNYKESISEPIKEWYETASDLLQSGKEKLSDYVIKEYGTEKYQEIIDSINSVKQSASNTWENIKEFGSEKIESGKESLDNWYQNFKNN